MRSEVEQEQHDRLLAAFEAKPAKAKTADLCRRLGIDVNKGRMWLHREKGRKARASQPRQSDTMQDLRRANGMTLDEQLRQVAAETLLEIMRDANEGGGIRTRAAIEANRRTEALAEAPDGEAEATATASKEDMLAAIATKVAPNDLAKILREQGFTVARDKHL